MVETMEKMFFNCELLTSLDISNFFTPKINNVNNMFSNCKELISLDLSKFQTSLVTSMENMFNNCKKLKYLDISNFDTSNINIMKKMFNNCNCLTSLDLSKFNTSKVTNMDSMFYNCYSLTSLDLSNFDTSKVTSLTKMFYSCISLSSLNLSNFNTNSFEDISSIFEKCNNLEYVNFYPLTSNEKMNISNMFLGTPDMFIYCLSDDKNILAQLESKECKYKDCLNNLEKSKEIRFENIKKTIEIFSDKCIFKSLQFMSKEFIISDKIPNITIYFYELNSNINELRSINKNLTFIYLTQEVIDNIRALYDLDGETDIYILIMDLPSNDSKTVTSDYDYKFIVQNGTELDLNNIKEDIYVNVSVPIRDLNSSNFNYAINFAEQGYDIPQSMK